MTPSAHSCRALRTPRSRWLLFAIAALLLVAGAAHAEIAAMAVQRVGAALRVQASARLHADAQTVWNTLVDYDRLPEFIPDIASSRTLRRDGDSAVVQQRGRAGPGPFKRDFSLTLAVQETPLQSVTARAVAGDFSRFESSYRLHSGANGSTHLDYTAVIEPKAGIPPLLGVPLMEWAIRRQFDAMLAEIERRGAMPLAASAARVRLRPRLVSRGIP